MTPHLGQTVLYRSRTGDYTMAAIVIANTRSINPLGVERGQVPPLTDDSHVHLTVLSPGLPPVETPDRTTVLVDPKKPLGSRIVELPPEGRAGYDEPAAFLGMTQFGSTYAEFDIPFWDPDRRVYLDAHDSPQPAGTWTFV